MATAQLNVVHVGPAREPSHYGYSRGCRCEGCVQAGKEYHAAYAKKHRARRLANHRKRLYDIEPEQYDALLERQGGLCAICGSDNKHAHKESLCVDHCHKTGEVRGLLCDRCNRALGLLGDDPMRISAALAYMGRHL